MNTYFMHTRAIIFINEVLSLVYCIAWKEEYSENLIKQKYCLLNKSRSIL